jgi:response regulator RpfG family c-di-GMP phosphodiesterase
MERLRLAELLAGLALLADTGMGLDPGQAARTALVATELAAAIGAAAGERAGLTAPAIVELRRAALLHDVGRAAIPNGIWERPGPLTWADQERVRLHAYHSERVLARSGPLADLATVAGMHHERLDGSGYHRQVAATAIGLQGRVLAAADVFQAMTQAHATGPRARARRPVRCSSPRRAAAAWTPTRCGRSSTPPGSRRARSAARGRRD